MYKRDIVFFLCGVMLASLVYFSIELVPTDGFWLRAGQWLKYWDTLLTGGLAAIAAFLVYLSSIEHNRGQSEAARKKATMELVKAYAGDQKRQAAQHTLEDLVTDGKKPVDQRQYEKDNYKSWPEDLKSAADYLLDMLELWGVGVKAGAYDLEVLSNALNSSIQGTWNFFEGSVRARRSTDRNVYANAQFLAEEMRRLRG